MIHNQNIFSNMRYCPETVIVQSALFLAEKLGQLEGKKTEIFQSKEVKVVIDAIQEVSKGLCIHGEEGYHLLSKEKQALHYKLHFWFYRTWCQALSLDSNDMDIEPDLDGFPSLPRFGTGFFISIVQHMEWEQLLVECLFNSPLLSSKLQEITSVILDSPTTKDTHLFALMFDNLLHHESSEADSEYPSSSEILITTLASLCGYIHDQNTQVCLLKRTIEYLFQHFFNTRTAPLSEDKKCPLSELKLGSINPPESQMSERESTDNINMIHVAMVLAMLFIEQWTEVSHWSSAQDTGGVEKIEFSPMWHPLHHWMLALYIVLTLIMKDNEKDEKLSCFCHGLGKYVDSFASISEKEWVCKGLEGTSIEWNCCTTIEECFDPNGCQQIMFSSESIQDTLTTAVWRVNENLPGCKACFNWLLSTEELFDDPIWLECITKNASSFAGKEELVMMIDIICVQRQMMENIPDVSSKVFTAIKQVVLDIFKDLSPLDQSDILQYAFSMSVVAGLDIKDNSIFFNPNHYEDNKKAFSEQLQSVFNKLVDDSQSASFQRTLIDIRKMALVCPYMVIHKVLYDAANYGHANKAIYQILQEIPILCSLCTSDSFPKVLLEILSLLMASVKTKQEEKNLVKLIQHLLQPNKKESIGAPSQPLANITELVQSCVIPHMRFKDDISLMKVSLKVLKSALTALDLREQRSKLFILKYLIPIVLTLAKHLYACKVSWEGMSPQISIPLSLSEVGYFRGHVLDVLGVSCHIIVRCFQTHVREITGPIDWLLNKVKDLDWSTLLHLKQLQDILPTKRPCYAPSCLIEICDLKDENWKFIEMEYCDVLLSLFQCCSLSDSILDEIVNGLKKDSLGKITENLADELSKTLIKVMSYFSLAELSRVITICKHLIARCSLDQKRDVESPGATNEAIYAKPSLRTAYLLSSVLHQVFKIVSQPCCSSWATPVTIGNMIKHYVNTIKGVYQELISGDLSDKVAVDDVIACIFTDICHVICLVPSDVTDPLFILALDIASNVNQRHADDLKNCVAMVPNGVYTESLIQKLSGM